MPPLAWATFVLAATGAGAVFIAPGRAAIAGEPVEVPNMVIRIVEQVDAPARETGALAAVNVTEGRLVTAGTLLAQIEDSEANLALERTKIELDVARRNAENDIAVRFAKKSTEVARAELQRCIDSVKKSPRSVSDSEMDRLRLLVEKGDLEIEQAQRDFVSATSSRQIKENEYKVALEKLERHRVSAPIAGLVVRVYRNRGEWVKPGEPVVRILRLDRLRAEGFLKARDVPPDLQGRTVKLIIDLPNDPGHEFPGKIAFVDPEVDPVNSQVRVWVEVLNQDLRLRPGMQAKMVIAPVAGQ